MNWNELIQCEIETTYKTAEGLLDLVDDEALGWKPSMGENWLTTGQLLRHIADASGGAFRGFVTGDWGLPEGMDVSEMTPEEMLPPAEAFPTVENVAEAKKLLGADKQLAMDMLAQCNETDLAEKKVTPPWDPKEQILGHILLQMVGHLGSHKNQLFYYLKLQGKPVNTQHLWAM